MEEILFGAYTRVAIEILIILLWGWGFLYSLSKITKYYNMFLGAIGCLGMMLLRIGDNLSQMPQEFFYVFANTEKILEYRNQIIGFWNYLALYYQKDALHILFQIFVVAALAGRFIVRAKSPAEVEQPEEQEVSQEQEIQERRTEEQALRETVA